MIPSGHTLILGGLDSTTEVESKSRIPGLGALPGLKWLFSTRNARRVKSRLLFFIKVRITSTGDTPPDTILPLPLFEDPEEG